MRANPACTVKMMFDNPQDKKLSGGKYAMFFDIDGTLVSFKTHQIPASAILALTQAKANGHKVFIATGRPPLIITNLGAIEHLLPGIPGFRSASGDIRPAGRGFGRGFPSVLHHLGRAEFP